MAEGRAVVVYRSQGRLQCHVEAVSDWDGFDKLVRFLLKYYQAKILKQVDGPDARLCLIQVGDSVLELHHEDPWGNTFVAPSPDAEQILQLIAADLDKRLSGGLAGGLGHPS